MNKIELYSAVINDMVSIVRQVKEERQNNVRKGKYINVFTLWNHFSGLTEPIHSRILAHPTNPVEEGIRMLTQKLSLYDT